MFTILIPKRARRVVAMTVAIHVASAGIGPAPKGECNNQETPNRILARFGIEIYSEVPWAVVRCCAARLRAIQTTHETNPSRLNAENVERPPNHDWAGPGL